MKHVHVLEPVNGCGRRGFSIEHKAQEPTSGPGNGSQLLAAGRLEKVKRLACRFFM